MNGNRTLAIASYITWVGWLIALLAREKEDVLVRHHLNQALILNVIATLCGIIAKLGWIMAIVAGIISLVVFVFWIMGIIKAVQRSIDPLPIVGDFTLIN